MILANVRLSLISFARFSTPCTSLFHFILWQTQSLVRILLSFLKKNGGSRGTPFIGITTCTWQSPPLCLVYTKSQALKYTSMLLSYTYVIGSMGKCKNRRVSAKIGGFKNNEISQYGMFVSGLEDLEKLQSDDNGHRPRKGQCRRERNHSRGGNSTR